MNMIIALEMNNTNNDHNPFLSSLSQSMSGIISQIANKANMVTSSTRLASINAKTFLDRSMRLRVRNRTES